MDSKTKKIQERLRNLQDIPSDIIFNDNEQVQSLQTYKCLCQKTYWSLSCLALHLKGSQCSRMQQCEETRTVDEVIMNIPPLEINNFQQQNCSTSTENINYVEMKPDGKTSIASCPIPKRTDPIAIECLFCDSWSIRASNYRNHLKRIHGYQAHKLGNIILRPVYNLESLIDDSHYTNNIGCDICKDTFYSRQEYKTHLFVR